MPPTNTRSPPHILALPTGPSNQNQNQNHIIKKKKKNHQIISSNQTKTPHILANSFFFKIAIEATNKATHTLPRTRRTDPNTLIHRSTITMALLGSLSLSLSLCFLYFSVQSSLFLISVFGDLGLGFQGGIFVEYGRMVFVFIDPPIDQQIHRFKPIDQPIQTHHQPIPTHRSKATPPRSSAIHADPKSKIQNLAPVQALNERIQNLALVQTLNERERDVREVVRSEEL